MDTPTLVQSDVIFANQVLHEQKLKDGPGYEATSMVVWKVQRSVEKLIIAALEVKI